jgi:NTP pyrophosphatase (non-canonical NTP hydrolase)
VRPSILRPVVDNLNRIYGSSDEQYAIRLLKLAEEAGEAAQAFIGCTGQNPRKGFSHTRDDVASELCDVIITAAVALHGFTEAPDELLAHRIRAAIELHA